MPVVNLPLQIYVYALLVLPCIFSSALIMPDFFSPFRVPLYLISVVAVIPLLYKTPTQTAKAVTLMVSLLLFAAMLSGLWVDERQFLANLRQWMFYSITFMCGIVGIVVARITTSPNRFAEQLLILFSLLFLYGIYTYFAQMFELPELLYMLRPNPGLPTGHLYSQSYSGWGSAMRAYSVWFEPTITSLVLACALPLLYFQVNWRIKLYFTLITIPYVYLTFSRSAWLVGLLFFFGHLLGLFKLKLSRVGLFTMAILISMVFVLLQLFAIGNHHESSALGRIMSVAMAMHEWLDSPLFGTGSGELINPVPLLHATHKFKSISASIPMMLHWYGLIGLLITLIPYWYLACNGSGAKNKVATSFIYLSSVAITVGGPLMMLSIFWFFWGFYMSTPQVKHADVT